MVRKRPKKNKPRNLVHNRRIKGHEVSAAQMLAERIASGGVDYINDNFIRVMTDSGQLAEEPEFVDLSMDGEKTVEVTSRWLKKYDKRLAVDLFQLLE